MSTTPGQRGQILILLAGYIFFGGGASAALLYLHGNTPGELEKAVKRVVTDESRSDAARSAIDQWADALKVQEKALGKARDRFVKLVRRHDATRLEADGIATDADESIRGMDGAFLDARFRVREHLTRAEWDSMWVHLDK